MSMKSESVFAHLCQTICQMSMTSSKLLVCKKGKMMMNKVQKWSFNCLRQRPYFFHYLYLNFKIKCELQKERSMFIY